MKSIASSALKTNLGDVLAAADHEPIAITRHSKTRYVIMDAEIYAAKFPRDLRRSYKVEETPDELFKMMEKAFGDDKG